ncbi:hypothetical protein P4V47_06795 [Brevibacillus laterosporus]|nr:hypothetical protein [Brevibacillus laterosporus]MED1787217.1 hypothetical protein [Brevibacillus laterosporus]
MSGKGQGFIAPYTGAWIETEPRQVSPSQAIIAPYTGAWIETKSS